MNMKKVLFIITKSNWGGAQRYVFDLATNLPKELFETIVACGGNGPLIEKLEKSGIRVIKIHHLERDINIMKEILSLFSLWQIFKKEKPDIIHLNSSKVGGLGALAARIYNLQPIHLPRFFRRKIWEGKTHNPQHARIIFTAHGWPFNEDRIFLARAIIWFLSWLTAVFSHRIIAITKNDYVSSQKFPFVSKSKLQYIPIGISNNIVFIPKEQARKELEVEIWAQSVLIGGITEFVKNKGIRYLIEAIKDLPGSAHLALIGGGEKRKEIEKLAEDLGVSGRIRFLEFKQDAAKFLKAFDIFVFPSIKEGLPYAVLEAGLAELPIVATNVGGIPDIITDQENGLLVEPKNPHALAKATKKLVADKNLREKLGKKLAEKIRTEFDFEKMLEETIQIYS